jgi:hypothetical protein
MSMPNEAAALARLPDLTIYDVSALLPAKDFPLSKKFYTALGWKVTEVDPTLAVMEFGSRRLYLQNFYKRHWAEYVELHIAVHDACAWYEHVAAILRGKAFAAASVQRPKTDLDGSLVTCVRDPSGIALHFRQWDG